MHVEGYPGLKMHHHTELWKSLDTRKEGRGLGVSVVGAWSSYQLWLNLVRSYCAENAERFQMSGRHHNTGQVSFARPASCSGNLGRL